jgi:hypothetical protein
MRGSVDRSCVILMESSVIICVLVLLTFDLGVFPVSSFCLLLICVLMCYPPLCNPSIVLCVQLCNAVFALHTIALTINERNLNE